MASGIENLISKGRGTMGVRLMPDALDSGGCHVGCTGEGVVRINLDGMWCTLCADHRDALVKFLLYTPLPSPLEESHA